MRLKSVSISRYKNLSDFTVDFDGENFIDVFVGKNGTGKSNLFEALIEIFRHVVESRDKLAKSELEYRIEYEIDDKPIEILWQNDKLSVNGNERRTTRSATLPDNVLIYYSGHNETIEGLLKGYEQKFRRRLRDADFDETCFFIGIGSEYKELLLAVLLMQPECTQARSFLCEKLGIESVGDTVTLGLKRPFFTNTKMEIEEFDSTTHYWGATGITKVFLDKIVSCVKGNFKHSDLYSATSDTYTIPINIDLFRKEFCDKEGPSIFRQFDNLKTLAMLEAVNLSIEIEGGREMGLSHFSDGQFQSVYIYSVVEMFKDRNCITLLDEPDSFLHPEWQFRFLKQVSDISETTTRKNHVLMSSHSAVTLISHPKERIQSLRFVDDHIKPCSVSKYFAIDELGGRQFRYSEQEQVLCLIERVKRKGKPVLFTEGETDSTILKEAWHRMYTNEMPFELCPVFGCNQVKQLLTNKEVRAGNEKLPLFGLFDYDLAYNQWKAINRKDTLQSDPLKGMVKQLNGYESYGIMIPVPDNDDIKGLVIEDQKIDKTFGADSCCEIEHLFYGCESTADYFKKERAPGGGTKIVFAKDKKIFANEIVPTLSNDMFEVFRPMFEFISSIVVVHT